MLTYQNIRYSERDCRENPAKHHGEERITMNSLNTKWCIADWNEKPDPAPFD
jgi:hypothetical protein